MEKDRWVGDILRRHDWQVNNPLNASGEVQGRVWVLERRVSARRCHMRGTGWGDGGRDPASPFGFVEAGAP